jgi:hypothetical protein
MDLTVEGLEAARAQAGRNTADIDSMVDSSHMFRAKFRVKLVLVVRRTMEYMSQWRPEGWTSQ